MDMELIRGLQSVLADTDEIIANLSLSWWRIALLVNAAFWLIDLGLCLKRNSRQETGAVMMLPGVVTFWVAAMTAMTVTITTGSRLDNGNVFMEQRACVELLILTVFFLTVWILNMALQGGGRNTWKRRILWAVSYVPDIIIMVCIFPVILARLIGGVNLLAELGDTSAALGFSSYNVFAWIFCYGVVSLIIRLVLLLIALFARVIFRRIPVGAYRENGHPTRRFLWYAAVCQNAYLRGVFALYLSLLLTVTTAILWEGVDSMEAAAMSVSSLLFFAVIGFGMVVFSMKPAMAALKRFAKWGDREAMLEQFCREYFNEQPLLRTQHYTLTRHFLVDERSIVCIYYLEMLQRWKCWQIVSERRREMEDQVYWSQPHTVSADTRSGWWWEITFEGGDTCFVEKEDVSADALINGLKQYKENHQLDLAAQQAIIRENSGRQDKYDKLHNLFLRVVLVCMVVVYFYLKTKYEI